MSFYVKIIEKNMQMALMWLNLYCTIGYGGSGIMAKKFGVFCTKICYFIEENKTQNGPLVFHTVLALNMMKR